MSDRKARTWQGKLFWAVAGAVAGSISTVLVDQAKDWAMEAATHREALFGEAMALRRAAIAENSEAKHKESNAAFERAWRAGKTEALAQLAIAQCHGLGVPRAPGKGHSMLVEVARLDRCLGAIYLNGKDVCPQGQESAKK